MEQKTILFYSKQVSAVKPTSLVVYLKTTETCQLNCSHCFTNGINGKQIYFDPVKTIDWFKRVHAECPTLDSGTIIFHGGEPFLAPLADMQKVWEDVRELWPNIRWSCSTNLTYNLTNEILNFFSTVLPDGFCTSWDKNIRFANVRQEELWRKNLKTLVDAGHNITLNVSLNKDLLQEDTDELVLWLDTLGVNYVQFERLTWDGSAVKNTHIFPANVDLDEWFVKMHKSYKKIKPKYRDVLIGGLYDSIQKGIHGGVRCRDCEQKIFTINADGSIAGCPNAAVDNAFGHIDQEFLDLLVSPKRLDNILCETNRDTRCYTCDVFDVCNSDCHQLVWEGDQCAAPRTLMKQIKMEL